MTAFALDTNVLAYSTGVRRGDPDGGKVERGRKVLSDLYVCDQRYAVRAKVLLSEDMRHGSTWQGTTIVNPFKSDFTAVLERLLNR